MGTLNLNSGTITGLNAGGLPDASVQAADLASGVGGKFASYAIIADVKADNANAGTFTSGAYRTRDLNTEIADADGIVSISSNQFTLGAGTYLIKWKAPVYAVGYHKSRLANITDTSYVNGNAMYSRSASYDSMFATGTARVTISGSKTYEIQHIGNETSSNTGFGLDHVYTNNATEAIYTTVEIFKEA